MQPLKKLSPLNTNLELLLEKTKLSLQAWNHTMSLGLSVKSCASMNFMILWLKMSLSKAYLQFRSYDCHSSALPSWIHEYAIAEAWNIEKQQFSNMLVKLLMPPRLKTEVDAEKCISLENKV